jgi:hypothetical protein
LLEKRLHQTTELSNNVIRLVDKRKYSSLNRALSSYIRRLPIRGQTKNELIWLTYRMNMRGRGLMGDVVQMTAEEVFLHACTISAIRNPGKLVVQLERALERLGFGLEMKAPGWLRVEPPTLEQLIAERDMRRELRENRGKQTRTSHLHLVPQ